MARGSIGKMAQSTAASLQNLKTLSNVAPPSQHHRNQSDVSYNDGYIG